MPALNFKKEFAALIESGQKTQTIRRPRKRPIKPGDMLYLYTGMRTKGCRKLGEAECISIEELIIFRNMPILTEILNSGGSQNKGEYGGAYIGNNGIGIMDLETLAYEDGFASGYELGLFFFKQYGLPFCGDLIKWKKARR